MAYDFNGSGDQYLTGTTGPTGTTFSISAWVWPDGFGGYGTIYAWGGEGLFHTTPGNLQYYSAGPTSSAALSTSGWSQVGVGAVPGSIQLYINGAEDGTSAGTGNLPDQATNGIGGHNGEYFNGRIAEVAIWTAKLDAAEWVALGKGFSPLLIRPASLKAYIPLIRSTADLRGLMSGTLTGTSVSAHPRVIYPRRRQAFSVAAAAGGYSSSFFRENAGLGAAGGGPFARANAGLGAIA